MQSFETSKLAKKPADYVNDDVATETGESGQRKGQHRAEDQSGKDPIGAKLTSARLKPPDPR